MTGPILLVPCVEKGRGGGHLVRSVALVRDLRTRGREAFLYVPGSEAGTGSAVPDLAPYLCPLLDGLDPHWLISGQKATASRQWAFIILDRFRTPAAEYIFWRTLAPLIGIDEGGPCRDDFDFLVDLLPGLPQRLNRLKPNILDVSLLPLPKNRRPHPWAALRHPAGPVTGAVSIGEPLKVLISFGAEDPAGLGPLIVQYLKRCLSPFELTLLDPAGGQRIPNLPEHLAEYDLLITHFGLTAFEAIHAGTPVLLVSPGVYHEKLAWNTGFVSAGIGKRGARRVSRLLAPKSGNRGYTLNTAFLERLNESCKKIAAQYGLIDTTERSFADLVGSISPLVSHTTGGASVCPACGVQAAVARPHRVLARFQDRTYRRCPDCGMVYMGRLNPPPIEYEKEYFFDFYKKQYGKTYIEDFPNLINMGKRRLAVIKDLLAHSRHGSGITNAGQTILDIGCAYGPFLQAGREAGFEPIGIDPAEDAVAYIRKELKIPAFQGFFPGTQLPEVLKDEAFSAVTLWYVIEHFRSPKAALEECRRILRPGGVLAFSTPSFRGVSGRKSPRNFLENSPADHWTVWSPGRCKKTLKKAGFVLKKIVVTGHHPERFPFLGKLIEQKRGPVYQCCLLASRLFGLGDTFEVYAVKIYKEGI